MFYVPKSNRHQQHLTFFVFIRNLDCTVNEKESRKILFEVMIASKIFQIPDDFWEQYSVQNKAIKKQVGVYEIESIDNVNIMNIPVNSKELLKVQRQDSEQKT